MTVSIWWPLAMFLVGGFAVIVVFTLMNMATRADKRVVKEEAALERDGLDRVELEEEWTRLRSPGEGAESMRAD
jgi:hypothetical protein